MQATATSPAAGLSEERQAAHDLLQLLKKEQELLVEATVDGLPELTAEKARLAARMQELAVRRHQSLGAIGFEANETGMQAWLDSAATAAETSSWSALLEAASAAKEQNRLNGSLIARHMARNQSALNVLQGNPQGSPSTYGPNGQSTTRISSTRLVVG